MPTFTQSLQQSVDRDMPGVTTAMVLVKSLGVSRLIGSRATGIVVVQLLCTQRQAQAIMVVQLGVAATVTTTTGALPSTCELSMARMEVGPRYVMAR